MIGLRNVLVHAYSRVDPLEVWAVVDQDIPALEEEVVALLSLLGGTEGAG
ncbi:HepT-like ribonuclease domain-containing protein [Methanoculleus chikugoensis]|nr:HepT-like ribonuclease domain-containing protein [Methanoculleus chikugoensis]